ncbi:hypothetical protein FOA43_001773 [Brettanomyces nanus]|uniref:Glutaredoxin domain-containing protein n=1 Tax=Eeniella nana TaxID=13502 RepID=A0A875S5H0_EENNA|nr:uncharacterized protein FOA43_001773 [Brettanomyces nanus]QPG74444.1 hypothetical protein FOA43_001773 [Brettanomyces nanus]
MSAFLLNARKRRMLGLAAIALFIVLLVSVTGSSSSLVKSTKDRAASAAYSDEVKDNAKPIHGGAASEYEVFGDSNSNGDKEPINVDTKKLINANDMVKDKKSGVIDESKVKEAEDNKRGLSGDIPLVAGDDAAAAAGYAKQEEAAESDVKGNMRGSSVASAEGAQASSAFGMEDSKGSEAKTAIGSNSNSDSDSGLSPAPIQADMQLRSAKKKTHSVVDEDEDDDASGKDNDGNSVLVDDDKEHMQLSRSRLRPGEKSDSLVEVAKGAFDAAKEYQEILQLSPVIIFSKTYCPYSKKLKEILTVNYEITPIPVIVELDMHHHGEFLQQYVGKKTGRSTVPNLLIKGVSRGGCDEISELHESGKLLGKLKQWAGSIAKIEKVNAPSNS